MVLSAPILHFQVWQDLQNLFAPAGSKTMAEQQKTKQVLLLSFVSGCFLFASQVLMYVAISQVATGVATSLFFIYPIVTVLISWLLLRDRPSLFITWAIAAIFCGELLMLGSNSSSMNYSQLGNITGVMSGIAFAGYVILTRLCATKLHPVTFTLINFSFICMMVPLSGDTTLAINTKNILEVVFSAFILGVLTLCGYLLNNFGIRQLGAIRSSVIGSAVPILTVILAGLMLQENLDIVQVMGVLLVSVGAAAISFEKMHASG
jgi:drug/metabolite transporter (DMT)-like permease